MAHELAETPVLAELAFALILALAICEGASRRDFRFAGTAWLVGLAYAALVLLAFWIGFTRPGSPTIDGIQGRYLFPTYFLLGVGIVAASPLGDRLRRLGPPLFCGLLVLDAVTLSAAVAHFRHYWHF
jgi:hypothetical protein